MELRILGPVEFVGAGGHAVPLARQQRTILARLAIDHRQVVSVKVLVSDLWADPPSRATNLVHNLVRQLRGAIAVAGAAHPELVLRSRPDGYLLALGQATDLDRFLVLNKQAHAHAEAGRQAAAAEQFAEALRLWRGEPLGGVAERLAATCQPSLTELRLATTEEWVDSQLALGRQADLVPLVTRLVAEHPRRDRLRGQLMLALYRTGRRLEALRVFDEGRRLLVEDSGLEPGPALRALHRAIHTEDRALDLPDGGARASRDGARVPPTRLPPPVADFVGRDAEISQALTVLSMPRSQPIAPVVWTVAGPPGVGKTALVLEVANRASAHFTDGQLFADLGGARGEPVSPFDVLGWFIPALGGTDRVPDAFEERLATYRGLLAARSVLVVLDDVADAAQLRPLLPAGEACGLVATSRTPLRTLEGASCVVLDVPPVNEAVGLFARAACRTNDLELTSAAHKVVERCGRLPLAVRAAGSQLAARPHWSAHRLAKELADEQHRLDRLAIGDLDVRTRFAAACVRLSEPARRLLYLAAHFTAPSFTAEALAARTGDQLAAVDELLNEICDAQLLTAVVSRRGGAVRYRFHGLVRIFARDPARHRVPSHRLSSRLSAGD